MSKSEDQAKVNEALETLIENEVERRIKDYPIKVYVGGRLVDIDKTIHGGGEVNIMIDTPLYFSESGKTGFVNIEMPRKMAI